MGFQVYTSGRVGPPDDGRRGDPWTQYHRRDDPRDPPYVAKYATDATGDDAGITGGGKLLIAERGPSEYSTKYTLR